VIIGSWWPFLARTRPPPRPFPFTRPCPREVEAEPPASNRVSLREKELSEDLVVPLVGDEPDAFGVEPLEQPVVEAAPIEDDVKLLCQGPP